MLPGEDGNSEVAIIEFDSKDEALMAQTRDQKMIDENTIEVQLGSGSTLYVTNFPPLANEEYIQNLFRGVSHIPSNSHKAAVADRVTAWRNRRHSFAITQVQYSPTLLLRAI